MRITPKQLHTLLAAGVGAISLAALVAVPAQAGGVDLADRARLFRILALIGVLNAAVGAWYYLRIVAIMFLDPAPELDLPKSKPAWSSFLAGVLCTIGTVLYFVAPQWLWDLAP